MMTTVALVSVVVLVLGCIGYGLLVTRLCGAHRYIVDPLEQQMLGFTVGVGTLGWLAFFPGVAGYFTAPVFWAVCLPAASYVVVWWLRSGISPKRPGFSRFEILLLALIVCVAVIDVIEGISPPADADSLAYHFALPADFLAAEQILFVPRAVSGAIPLLLHMTYAVALGTGGELALTLWATVTCWATVLLFYAVMRRHIPRIWALAAGLVLLTTPAVLYGGGNGQVEIRCALFAIAAVVFIVSSQQYNASGLMLLGGLCAGFFMGAKFYGLIFVGAAGLVILFQRGGVRNAAIFGSAALFAGFQWYFWNWLHTGDPIFPTLTNLLQFPDSAIWTRDFGRYFSQTLASGELPLDRTVFNWLSYPVFSIFNLVERLEGGRTGLGIFSVLILPLAVYGFSRPEYRRREFIVPLAVAFIFFTVWFFSGTTQRTRHLLPVYPLITLGFFPVAVNVARRLSLSFPLAAGVSIVVAMQIAGQLVFGANYVSHVFSAETRYDFYRRNVPGANAALWVAAELRKESKVGFMNRQLAYLLNTPSYMMHPHLQTLVDSRATVSNERLFVAQIKQQGITHLLIPGNWGDSDPKAPDLSNFHGLVDRLMQQGCLKLLREFDTLSIPSRTLRQFGGEALKTKDALFELQPEYCPQ